MGVKIGRDTYVAVSRIATVIFFWIVLGRDVTTVVLLLFMVYFGFGFWRNHYFSSQTCFFIYTRSAYVSYDRKIMAFVKVFKNDDTTFDIDNDDNNNSIDNRNYLNYDNMIIIMVIMMIMTMVVNDEYNHDNNNDDVNDYL